jgi:hypothetical protein
MSENVLPFPQVAIGDGLEIDPAAVLDASQKKAFTRLVVIGEQDDGGLYVAGTHGAGESLMLVEMAKKILIP